NEPVQLQVWDRLPKGENESVGVTLLKATPDLCKDGIYLRESRPNNLLRWDVEVPANISGEKSLAINYEFRMELDRQMAITGFQSKCPRGEPSPVRGRVSVRDVSQTNPGPYGPRLA